MRSPVTLFCALGLSTVVSALQLNVYHRVLAPTGPQSDFSLRGVISSSKDGDITYASTGPLSDSVSALARALPTEPASTALYQLTLAPEGATAPEKWPVSSVKACHLASATAEMLVLHVAEDAPADPVPFALDFFVAPTLPCTSETLAGALDAYAVRADTVNRTVTVRSPVLPPLPDLRTPPQISAEGAPVPPPVEKSFIQKYWMYMVAALIAILAMGGPEDMPERGEGKK
ncbi:hypothetical protein BD626DRAFT_534024 [Schizophyllum amplum]|uniref:Uncharacterized protein n=1 Tax=Schizophyllum amplum TaxID=97359 RepID=A0A550CS96_9AGAR|nr:hypothetical protein BD626DRAFT_534024 [Auriculariopsis ampla]